MKNKDWLLELDARVQTLVKASWEAGTREQTPAGRAELLDARSSYYTFFGTALVQAEDEEEETE